MFDLISGIYFKHKSLVIYFILSCLTALFEIILGWFILHIYNVHVVSANSLSTLAGALLHYYLTLKYAFNASRNYKTAIIYILTFIVGLLIQNVVIWLMYEYIFNVFREFIRFAASKIMSLSVSFFVIFFIRNTIYRKFSGKGNINE